MDIFSPKWWISTFVSTFITMLFIVLIKRVSSTVNIPVVSAAVAEV